MDTRREMGLLASDLDCSLSINDVDWVNWALSNTSSRHFKGPNAVLKPLKSAPNTHS